MSDTTNPFRAAGTRLEPLVEKLDRDPRYRACVYSLEELQEDFRTRRRHPLAETQVLRDLRTSPLLPEFHHRAGITEEFTRSKVVGWRNIGWWNWERLIAACENLSRDGLVEMTVLGTQTFKIKLTDKGAAIPLGPSPSSN